VIEQLRHPPTRRTPPRPSPWSFGRFDAGDESTESRQRAAAPSQRSIVGSAEFVTNQLGGLAEFGATDFVGDPIRR
jgi:hypothetical protein